VRRIAANAASKRAVEVRGDILPSGMLPLKTAMGERADSISIASFAANCRKIIPHNSTPASKRAVAKYRNGFSWY